MKFWWWYGSRQKFRLQMRNAVCIHNTFARASNEMETTFLYQKCYDWHTERKQEHPHYNIQTPQTHTRAHAARIRSHPHTETRATIFQPLSSAPLQRWWKCVDGTKARYILVDLFVCVCLSMLWCAMVDGFLLIKTIKITTKRAFSTCHSPAPLSVSTPVFTIPKNFRHNFLRITLVNFFPSFFWPTSQDLIMFNYNSRTYTRIKLHVFVYS